MWQLMKNVSITFHSCFVSYDGDAYETCNFVKVKSIFGVNKY